MRRFAHYAFVVISLVGVGAGWGLIHIFTKLSLSHGVGPIPQGMVRFGVSALLMAAFGLPFERKNLVELFESKAQWMLAIGAIIQTIASLLYIFALEFTTATNAAIIFLLTPVFTMGYCMAFRNEPKGVVKMVGLVVCLGGAAMVLEIEKMSLDGGTLFGDLLMIVAVMLWASYLLLMGPLLQRLPPTMSGSIGFAWIFIILSIFVFPVMEMHRWNDADDAGVADFVWGEIASVLSQPSSTWLSLGGLVASTAVPYAWCNFALKHTSETVVSVFMPTEVVFTVLFAIPFFGEVPTVRQGIGSMLVYAGILAIAFAQWRESRKGEKDGEPSDASVVGVEMDDIECGSVHDDGKKVQDEDGCDRNDDDDDDDDDNDDDVVDENDEGVNLTDLAAKIIKQEEATIPLLHQCESLQSIRVLEDDFAPSRSISSVGSEEETENYDSSDDV